MSGFGAKEEDDLLGQARVLLTFPGAFANESARARDGFGTRPEFVARSHAADPALSERVFEALEVVKSASDTLEELARRNRTLEADASRAVTVFRDRAEKATRDLAEVRARHDELSSENARLVGDFERRRFAYEDRIRRQDEEISRMREELGGLEELVSYFNRQVGGMLGKAPRLLEECARPERGYFSDLV